MLVLGAVVDQQEEPGSRQALHQAIEQGLVLRINPVEIFEHQQQRLHLTFAQEYPLEGIEGALASLRWIECQERAVFWERVQE